MNKHRHREIKEKEGERKKMPEMNKKPHSDLIKRRCLNVVACTKSNRKSNNPVDPPGDTYTHTKTNTRFQMYI